MAFLYGIDQSNPTGSNSRAQAQRKAMWVSFAYFLERTQRFILHYWPPDEDVAPILAMGFQPEPSYVSPKARQLSGTLTSELRTILLGPGEGTVPWFKVELSNGGNLIYYIEEHEDTAGWNCSQEDLAQLCAAGVDPSLVLDLEERRRHWEAQRPAAQGLEFLAMAVSRSIDPTAVGYGSGSYGGQDGSERVFALIRVGPGPEVWLHYEPIAMAQVGSPESARALVDGLRSPVQPGDNLRLDQEAGKPVLAHASRLLGPRRRNVTHSLVRPTRAEWVAAIRTMANRADHFAFCWREEPPAVNGWRSDYGHDRLVPFATDFGPIDFPAGARQMAGPLTPEALEAICTEPPHGLPDLEHDGPRIWQEGELPPSPWWCLLLLSGQDVLIESRDNGDRLSLSLMPEELAQLNLPQGRLHDHALANRQGRNPVGGQGDLITDGRARCP